METLSTLAFNSALELAVTALILMSLRVLADRQSAAIAIPIPIRSNQK